MKKFSNKLNNFFGIEAAGSAIRTEIIAGVTTFFAMCYIVVVNPNMMLDFAGEFAPHIWNAIFIGGILAAVIGTLLMAFVAKLPFAQAAGMGLNSFFFVSFILPNIDNIEEGYGAGLAIILISGIIFLILSATGLRKKIAVALPDVLKKAIPAGIGLFIAFIGLKNSGLVIANQYTFVSLANFTVFSTAAGALVAFVGLLVIAILGHYKVKGNIIIGILSSTILFYLVTWTAPDFGDIVSVDAFGDFFKYGILNLNFGAAFGTTFATILSAIMLVITFALVDMFDTVGTLYATCSEADMLDENGNPLRMEKAMLCDSIATVSGALIGTSTVTTYVESAAGVSEGGRTGLTSVVTAFFLLICMFFSPLAAVIPAAATAPALIYVGVLMLKGIRKVNFDDITLAVPAFLTIIMMPLTYSIANGIGIGALSYVIIRLCTRKFTKEDIIVAIIAVLFTLKFIFVVM